MTDVKSIVSDMCERYQSAVNANDSLAYKQLFAPDAVRIPPGSAPEYGPDEIARGEQKDYDTAKWTIESRPVDALKIHDDWVYVIAHVDVTTVRHDDGTSRSFAATKTWLLQRQPSGVWLVKRQMWNLR